MFAHSLPTDQTVIVAVAALLGLSIVAASMLRGWQAWLQVRLREIEAGRPGGALAGGHLAEPGAASGMSRIEMADLRERVRKLEAIASGVDL